MRLGSSLPAGDSLGGSWWWQPAIALSPDGTRLAYVATHEGVRQLYLRDVGEWNGRPLPGTQNAHTPFFSPDGRWLGAVVGRTIVKIPVAGGPLTAIATAPYDVYGACWSADGWIYFGSEAPLGMMKVHFDTESGSVFEVMRFEAKSLDSDQRFPEVLPGGETLLLTVRKGPQPNFDEADIEAVSLKTIERHVLIKGGTNPRYIPSGHLLFLRAGVLMAVPFDAAQLQVKGTPVPVVEGILENPRVGAGQYTVAADGSLAYIAGGATFGEHELVSVDRSGAIHALSAARKSYSDIAISPDGRTLATTIEGNSTGVWLHDIAKDSDANFAPGTERRAPNWSLDGKTLYSSGYKAGEWAVYWKPLDGSHKEDELLSQETPVVARTWTRDGRAIFDVTGPNGRTDIGIHVASPKAYDAPLVATAANEEGAQLSPDNQWLAYNSDKSGRMEVYVSDFPHIAQAIKVSTEGGVRPRWSPDGKELYYRMDSRSGFMAPQAERTRLMAVPVETASGFKAGTPHMIVAGPFFESLNDYAVMPDGKGFIFIRDSQSTPPPSEVKLVLNWVDELKHRVPVN